MVSTRLILTTLWLFLVCSVSWSCLPCDLVTCEPLHLWQCDDYRQRILDPKCGCCPVCPKKELERCGGETNDQCETGLICRYRSGNILGIHKTGMCEPGTWCKQLLHRIHFLHALLHHIILLFGLLLIASQCSVLRGCGHNYYALSCHGI